MPCLNSGTCIEDNNSNRQYHCECRKGWSGRHCEDKTITCAEKPCTHGACVDSPTGFKCTCPVGFSGVNCEIQVDDCNPNPCENSGSCITRGDTFKCSCPIGYSGTRCEVNIDDCKGQPCRNGGTCIDLVNTFRCQCVPGYIGVNCADKVDICVTKPCANGGACISLNNDYRCTCRPGFTGKDCSIDIDECESAPCKNGGTCVNRVNSFQCVCPNGYRGSQCEDEAYTAASYDAVSSNTHHEAQSGRSEALSGGQVVAIAILSTSVPLVALIAACIVLCMKKQRKRAQEKDDAEARKQNEQNASANLHHGNSMLSSKRSSSSGLTFDNTIQPPTIIKNTWDKSVNNISSSASVDECLMNTSLYGAMSNYSDQTVSSDCYTVQQQQIAPLQRARSQKQLNTDPSVMHRASQIITPKEFLLDHKRISIVGGVCGGGGGGAVGSSGAAVPLVGSLSGVGLSSADTAFCNQRWPPPRQCVP